MTIVKMISRKHPSIAAVFCARYIGSKPNINCGSGCRQCFANETVATNVIERVQSSLNTLILLIYFQVSSFYSRS